MRRFEYELETEIQGPEIQRLQVDELRRRAIAHLNDYGAAGWELVQQEVQNVGQEIWIWRIWKRELEK